MIELFCFSVALGDERRDDAMAIECGGSTGYLEYLDCVFRRLFLFIGFTVTWSFQMFSQSLVCGGGYGMGYSGSPWPC